MFVEIGQGALLAPRPSERVQPLAGNGTDHVRAPGNCLEQGGVEAAQTQQQIRPRRQHPLGNRCHPHAQITAGLFAPGGSGGQLSRRQARSSGAGLAQAAAEHQPSQILMMAIPACGGACFHPHPQAIHGTA